MSNKKVELLAPAGDFSCFMAAINAGADAVYLGGSKFGARAFANNFTEAEIIESLKIAHLFGKRIYLTANTLVKAGEMNELVPYIAPLYEAGLDGVIVQDIGVLKVLRECFPNMALHASTQMTITGVYGAELIKSMGVCRIVPARELSLDEIKDIKNRTGLEIESFIHGAMCYSYSGQCLLSSILGGRSGNRGRCAGPCRLPYTDEKGNTIYPLSLKDMYTLPIIPKLIEAGIDSFKIEGRMKSPEYVAGVTAIYRKYIDKYLDVPIKQYKVDKRDEELLRGLYIRSDICSGYYEQHNARSMITISEAGYSGSSEDVLESIRQKFLNRKPTLSVQGYVRVYVNEPLLFTLSYKNCSVTVEGECASAAQNRPLLEEDIRSRFSKLGDTYFIAEGIDVDTDSNSFVPVKTMNELRRHACDELERLIIGKTTTDDSPTHIKDRLNTIDNINISMSSDNICDTNIIAASAATHEQLIEISKFSDIKRVYIDADLLIKNNISDLTALEGRQLYLALPYILRKCSYKYLAEYQQLLKNNAFMGVLVRNFEELQWLNSIDYDGQIISDHTVYIWNSETDRALEGLLDRSTVSVELNRGELQAIGGFSHRELIVYARLALMYSANCVRKTTDKCIGNSLSDSNIYRLTDRYNNTFPIIQCCKHCYNILYNTVPLSLHGKLDRIRTMGFNALRLDFTIENSDETREILEYYINGGDFPLKSFTNGHYKRGVD